MPPLAPGNGATQTIPFTITDNTPQPQTLSTETVVVTSDVAGGVYDTTSRQFVDTCQAAWFSVTWGDGGIPLPHVLTPGSSMTTGAAFVTMPANTSVDQSACEGLNPQITLTLT